MGSSRSAGRTISFAATSAGGLGSGRAAVVDVSVAVFSTNCVFAAAKPSSSSPSS
eukprot:CAMPEP_0179476118 /NCGR_PEP_ID=MMETSP0799-20121207/55186_1 /TAXON_ID=46947 /ORGANISM="Geminigera cryophila, Strain CCMP2564" /LENGTH=54 /DNA_ID=CAMNT_0021286085 /DNA_START=89 /DNA_END=250 /DNA_ORIENTATION=+